MKIHFLALSLSLLGSCYTATSLAADAKLAEQKSTQLETIMPAPVASKQAEPQEQKLVEKPETPPQKCTYGHAESVDL